MSDPQSKIVLSDDQKLALDVMVEWYTQGNLSTMTVGGYAGTGKSTLISQFRENINKSHRIAFCCYTGKASNVLRNKMKMLTKNYPGDTISTIHSLIYVPVIDEITKKIIRWELKKFGSLDYDLIVIDEASMVDQETYADLLSFGIPILAVGDHGQLPPVSGNSNLMNDPIVKLEKIHRQAKDNPIIHLSEVARNEGYIPYGVFGNGVAKVQKNSPIISNFIYHSKNFKDTVLLCGFNKTRVQLNKKIREFLKLDSNNYPCVGDRVVCLKNNREAKNCPIYNGVQGTIVTYSLLAGYAESEIAIDGEDMPYFGPLSHLCWNQDKPDLTNLVKVKRLEFGQEGNAFKMVMQYPDLFDYGYSLSVHKSQGSEWDRVLLIEQPCQHWSGENWNRWLYTAITRAKRQLLIVY